MPSRSSTRRQFLNRTAVLGIMVGIAGCLTESTDSGGDDQTSPIGGTGSDDSNGTASEESSERPQTLSFKAPHGATIEATQYGSGDCGVVLVLQINKNRESWKPQAELIANQGHQVLAIDEDPGNRSASVRGAMKFLRSQRDVSTLVLIGASSGSEAVVIANANAPADGAVTLSAGGGADRASDLQGQLLFVVSKNDDDRFVRVARNLHEGAAEPKELVEYEGSTHGQGMFETEHGDDLMTKIQALIADACEK